MKKFGCILIAARCAFVAWCVVLAAVASSLAGEDTKPCSDSTVSIYMPDGQLKSHVIRVYVSRDILPNEQHEQPQLQLLRSHAVTKKAMDETVAHEPQVVAPGQEWLQSVDGQQVRKFGTLLLFDLSNMEFGYGAMLRVTPVVSWTDSGTKRIAVAASEVNIGNIIPACAWTLLIVGVALLTVILLPWLVAGRNPLQLLTGVDGHLSLAQTQIACWTVAVGSVVLGYGLIRLEVPTIPSSLLVLMGASLATGGVGFFQDARNLKAAVDAGTAKTERAWTLADLLYAFTPGQPPELSLAKAQMIFWTAILLVLFISKSVLDGAIWEVPWALVALMGFSQAGYLAPKLATTKPSGAAPEL